MFLVVLLCSTSRLKQKPKSDPLKFHFVICYSHKVITQFGGGGRCIYRKSNTNKHLCKTVKIRWNGTELAKEKQRNSCFHFFISVEMLSSRILWLFPVACRRSISRRQKYVCKRHLGNSSRQRKNGSTPKNHPTSYMCQNEFNLTLAHQWDFFIFQLMLDILTSTRSKQTIFQANPTNFFLNFVCGK